MSDLLHSNAEATLISPPEISVAGVLNNLIVISLKHLQDAFQGVGVTDVARRDLLLR